jgi:hypothetical protein
VPEGGVSILLRARAPYEVDWRSEGLASFEGASKVCACCGPAGRGVAAAECEAWIASSTQVAVKGAPTEAGGSCVKDGVVSG